jgi:hypothetical protein
MGQAGCQIHPVLQTAHAARFAANHALLQRLGRAAISALFNKDLQPQMNTDKHR